MQVRQSHVVEVGRLRGVSLAMPSLRHETIERRLFPPLFFSLPTYVPGKQLLDSSSDVGGTQKVQEVGTLNENHSCGEINLRLHCH